MKERATCQSNRTTRRRKRSPRSQAFWNSFEKEKVEYILTVFVRMLGQLNQQRSICSSNSTLIPHQAAFL